MKDVVVDNIQTIRTQLYETLKDVRLCAEEVIIKWFKEKELKDDEIAAAMQQLVNGILTVSSRILDCLCFYFFHDPLGFQSVFYFFSSKYFTNISESLLEYYCNLLYFSNYSNHCLTNKSFTEFKFL